jgi:hypothetical protein
MCYSAIFEEFPLFNYTIELSLRDVKETICYLDEQRADHLNPSRGP